MEWELRFGLDLGQLAVLPKRDWADYEQLLRVVSSIVSCSNRDTSPWDLSIMALLRAISFLYQPLVFLWILKRIPVHTRILLLHPEYKGWSTS